MQRHTRRMILEEAIAITTGNREEEYGPPENNFQNIANFWNSYIQMRHVSDVVLQPADVAWMLVLLKVARNTHKQKVDNSVDAAGYAALAGELSATGHTDNEPEPSVIMSQCPNCGRLVTGYLEDHTCYRP